MTVRFMKVLTFIIIAINKFILNFRDTFSINVKEYQKCIFFKYITLFPMFFSTTYSNNFK